MRIPTELRNAVYELIFSTTMIKVRSPWDDEYSDQVATTSHISLALLQTCRQINAEAASLFFSNTALDLQRSLLGYLLEEIGSEKAALITSLVINMAHACCWHYLVVTRKNRAVVRAYPALGRLYVVGICGEYLVQERVVKDERVYLAKGDLVVTFGPGDTFHLLPSPEKLS
jgi:hypothetical protein